MNEAKQVKEVITEQNQSAVQEPEQQVVKRGRGRPRGSKNKVKVEQIES